MDHEMYKEIEVWMAQSHFDHNWISTSLPMFIQEGRQAGDVAIGRYLADTMAIVPRFSRAEFERMFNESVQDSVMVSYLANLMRAQVGVLLVASL